MKKLINIGCHLSIKGSLLNIFKEANDLDITTIACFTGSNLQYNFNTSFSPEIVAEFQKKILEKNYSVYSHANYLINIADTQKTENYLKSINGLTSELLRCDLLAIKGVSFHPGSNFDRKSGLQNISQSINTIYQNNTIKTELYIEPSAGEGNKIPSTIEEIEYIFKNIHREFIHKIGVTIDTCHIFASGYDISTASGIDNFLQEFDNKVGIEKIKLIHLNDSQGKCGSKKDRHESIGKGQIGIEGIAYFINNEYINHLPKILETPVNHYMDWQKELSLLESLLKK